MATSKTFKVSDSDVQAAVIQAAVEIAKCTHLPTEITSDKVAVIARDLLAQLADGKAKKKG